MCFYYIWYYTTYIVDVNRINVYVRPVPVWTCLADLESVSGCAFVWLDNHF